MQVKLLSVNFYLNGRLLAVSIGKPSEHMSNFWMVQFLKTEPKPNFSFRHVPTLYEKRFVVFLFLSNVLCDDYMMLMTSQLLKRIPVTEYVFQHDSMLAHRAWATDELLCHETPDFVPITCGHPTCQTWTRSIIVCVGYIL